MIAQLYERIGLDWKLRQTERSHSVTLKTSRLPLEPFRYYQYGERTVHLDGCVEVEAAYYSAPPLWIGRRGTCNGFACSIPRPANCCASRAAAIESTRTTGPSAPCSARYNYRRTEFSRSRYARSITYRELHADTASPQPSSSCPGPTHLYFPTVTGAGVFRFQAGSLLTVRITEGAVCADLTAGVGHLTVTYQITGGTGRFKSASGALTLTATLMPVLLNASNAPELLTNTGEFEETVFGVAIGEEGQDER